MGRRSSRKRGASSAAAAATESGGGEEKEKEKQAAKGRAGRKGRKEKEKEEEEEKQARTEEEEEGAATVAGRQFFKVFFPEQSAEILKIPTPFQEYLEEEPDREVTLRGPSGGTWHAVLASDSPGPRFTTGWKDFARDHSLAPGHFLTFTYDGSARFSVAVFCASGVEDKATFRVRPSKPVVVKLEPEEGSEEDVCVGGGAASEGNGTPTATATRKRVRKVCDVMENGTAPKRQSAQKKPEKRKKPEAAAVDASEAEPTVVQDSSSLLEDPECGDSTRVKSKDVPRMGTFVAKKCRQPVVVSQRRPVTEQEKNNAFKRAKQFKSKNPFAVQVMMESYVYVGFFLTIPCEFVRKSLPRASKMMTLWDPQGKAWKVNYVYYDDRSVAAFSGGWGKFAISNNLEKFDVCVFELFKEDNIKVHIYRVVPEITPLIRSSSM